MKPTEEAEDKELVSLFDDYPDPHTTGENKENNQSVMKQDKTILIGDSQNPIVIENAQENVQMQE